MLQHSTLWTTIDPTRPYLLRRWRQLLWAVQWGGASSGLWNCSLPVSRKQLPSHQFQHDQSGSVMPYNILHYTIIILITMSVLISSNSEIQRVGLKPQSRGPSRPKSALRKLRVPRRLGVFSQIWILKTDRTPDLRIGGQQRSGWPELGQRVCMFSSGLHVLFSLCLAYVAWYC